jgi:hypothetical protein
MGISNIDNNKKENNNNQDDKINKENNNQSDNNDKIEEKISSPSELPLSDSSESTESSGKKIESEQNRNILFSVISFLSFFVIPILTVIAIVFFLITSSNFYTGIVKNANLLSAFIESRNAKLDIRIQNQIEKEVQLSKYENKFEKIKNKFEKIKSEFDTLNKTNEFISLEKKEEEISEMEWENFNEQFTSEEEFDKYVEKQEEKIEKEKTEIEEYRDNNEEAIEALEDKFEKKQEKYEDALSVLQDKKEDALEIIEDNKDTFAGEIFSDLEILEPALTKIFNEKLIDKGVKREIEKLLSFLTNYYKQKDRRKLVYKKPKKSNQKILHIHLPRFFLSLKVEDELKGKKVKRHLLSEILVDEINKYDNLNNKNTFITTFKLADTSIGEYLGNQFLSEAGVSLKAGVIKMKPLTLKGEHAEQLEKIMLLLTWSKYLKYVILVMIILLFVYVIFSRAERGRKFSCLQRTSIVPSLIIIIISAAALGGARLIPEHFPDLIKDPSILIYARSAAYIIAKEVFIPFLYIFGGLFLAGLIIRLLKAKFA